MKKAHFRSALFLAIIALSISSFIFLQSQKSTPPALSEIPKIEDTTEAEDTTSPILPDAEILKEIVKKGKKYISIAISI